MNNFNYPFTKTKLHITIPPIRSRTIKPINPSPLIPSNALLFTRLIASCHFEMLEATTMYAQLKKVPYTSLTLQECASLLAFVHSKRISLKNDLPCTPLKDHGHTILFFKDHTTLICLDHSIGRGRFSTIELGYTPQQAACRALSLTKGIKQREMTAQGYARAEKIPPHPNLVSIRRHATISPSSQKLLVVVEDYIPGVTLETHLKHHTPTRKEGLHLAIQLLKGLAHLHRHHLIHQDLKPSNLMITPTHALCIIDYGFVAPDRGATPSERHRNLIYSAPQQRLNTKQSIHKKNDIWAAGALLWDLLGPHLTHALIYPTFEAFWDDCQKQAEQTLNMPPNMTPEEWSLTLWCMQEIAAQTTSLPNWPLKPNTPPDPLALLIASMLHPHLKHRPTASQALRSLSSFGL